ncbi:MAG: LLM class flavin-dependent oxidoreductase [Alphaproteobacteria bacterium]|nr:LLM class flavin-dependent oxidoreductase [Alphaproteobacteria bacterium]
MKLGIWTPLPHTIRAEPEMDAAIAQLKTRGGPRTEDPSFRFAIDIVRRAEAIGFETTLIAERLLGPDLEAWIVGAALARETRAIELMVAIHPGIVHPQMIAKMGAALDRVSAGRLALNIVNGWYKEEFELFGNGATLDAEDGRYRRMDEYIQVIKGLWTSESYTLDGEFYRARGASLPIKSVREPYPPIYAASRSPLGRDVVARTADVWFVTYEPYYGFAMQNLETIARDVADMKARAASYGRALGFGISAHVICAESLAAAEREAEALEAYGKRDPVSMVAARALGPGLVGTPDMIADRMRVLEAAGVEIFMIHFHPMREGLETFAREIMPRLGIARGAA